MKERKYHKNKIPHHLAIILDGNGRWAKKKGLPRTIGHKMGAENIIRIVKHCQELGVKVLTLYCFSTENFKRPQPEVDYLMNLPIEYYQQYKEKVDFQKLPYKVVHVGKREQLKEELLVLIDEVEAKTNNNEGLLVNVAFNYGFYDELKRSLEKMNKAGDNDFSSENLISYLDVKIPVDLLIRTSGELRLSNFLLYQLAYSELYFTKKYWPAFKKRDLLRAFKSYQKRKRRYGGL